MVNKFLILIAAVLMFSCSENLKKDTPERETKGKYVYGGNIKTAGNEKYFDLFPVEIVSMSAARVSQQIHEGLVKFNPNDLTVINAVAESWEKSADDLVYTFSIKKNVFFHDDPCFEGGNGRQVNAHDFIYSFELLCGNNRNNSNYEYLFKEQVVGAKSFHSGHAKSIEGIVALDDFTLSITLVSPNPTFIYSLASPACVVIPKEAYEKYETNLMVGVGAFAFSNEDPVTGTVYLKFHPKYHLFDDENNRLPYADSLTFKYYESKLDEYDAFASKKLSFIDGLPSSKVAEILQENINNFETKPPIYELKIEPEAMTQYYEFNMTKPPFDNVLVRQAFNYAINRPKIIDNALNGQGIEARYGLVPKIRAFSDYPFEEVQGYNYNPEKAQELLAQAGYPHGENFPTVSLEINSGGNVNNKVAAEIERQLKTVLNVNVSRSTVSFLQKIEDSKYSKADIFRSAWIADFPSPENFLMICHGANVPSSTNLPSYPNTMRYVNATFDSLYEAGIGSSGASEKMRLLAQAEKIMMEDAPMMMLWYGEDYKIIHSNVQNYHHNALNFIDFSKIYLKHLTEDEYKEIKGLE
ncbi:MAG: ABC transporter substrate-binding protein [Flavobacteriales bacterium]|nr:ABC transporter substrate-binding protein [Flavobacteriales bacterium]